MFLYAATELRLRELTELAMAARLSGHIGRALRMERERDGILESLNPGAERTKGEDIVLDVETGAGED